MISARLTLFSFVPFPIRRAFAQAGDPSSPEENLWREVIARAVMDALGYTGVQSEADEHLNVVEDARDWLLRGINTAEVFDLAGMGNVDDVIDSIRETPPTPPEQQKRGRAKIRS
jgi:hypothetical protein